RAGRLAQDVYQSAVLELLADGQAYRRRLRFLQLRLGVRFFLFLQSLLPERDDGEPGVFVHAGRVGLGRRKAIDAAPAFFLGVEAVEQTVDDAFFSVGPGLVAPEFPGAVHLEQLDGSLGVFDLDRIDLVAVKVGKIAVAKGVGIAGGRHQRIDRLRGHL